jgi:hypothetical protein
LINDPDEQLYAAMIGISSGTISKSDFATVLEALSSPVVADDR